MTDTVSLLSGTLVGGHYIINSLINRGGFGAVYRGIDTSEGGRPCAIKETYDVTPAARRQALMEAAVLFTIKSDHLPQVYDAFEDSGRFYLVMQLIEGQNLLEIMRQRGSPCSEQEVLRWMLPIIDVLNELHSRHPPVMHRDIKPGNIIITPAQNAVLVDFGLTKLYDPGIDTQSNMRAVSEGFSPVEQYIGKTSPQSDIYSLAATMYFLLTGYVPLSSIQRSVHDDLIPPRRLNPQISSQVEQGLLKAMALNADFRFDSMSEFARALQQPLFTGYSDLTVANSSAQGSTSANGNGMTGTMNKAGTAQPKPTYPILPSLSPELAPLPPPPPGRSMQQPIYLTPGKDRQGRKQRRSRPQKNAPANQLPVYPMLPSRPQVKSPPPAQPMPVPNYKPLPGAYNQGCLWGIISGALSAALILTSKNQPNFYLTTAMGLLFYLVAGFFTTRKGGSSFRGAWAGFWAGISSTIIFWVVLVIGLLVQVARLVQNDTNAARLNRQPFNINTELSRDFQLVTSNLGLHSSMQSGNSAIITYLAAGLLCAMALGWVGGMLGSMRFRARMRRKGYA